MKPNIDPQAWTNNGGDQRECIFLSQTMLKCNNSNGKTFEQAKGSNLGTREQALSTRTNCGGGTPHVSC